MKLSVISLVVLLVTSCALSSAGSAEGHDGAWWLSLDREQRLGYAAGYMHKCFPSIPRSWYLVEQELSDYLESDPVLRNAEAGELVQLTVERALSTDDIAEPQDRQELQPIVFDGEYWRQALPSHRLGFVTGYLDCSRLGTGSTVVSERDSGLYVDRLSQWYGVNEDDPGQIDPARSDRRIANLLESFLEGSSNPAPN